MRSKYKVYLQLNSFRHFATVIIVITVVFPLSIPSWEKKEKNTAWQTRMITRMTTWRESRHLKMRLSCFYFAFYCFVKRLKWNLIYFSSLCHVESVWPTLSIPSSLNKCILSMSCVTFVPDLSGYVMQKAL